ncbi:MAG TPA: IS1595 family transposase [Bryobacteraceae bacterium]|nr:IS1595 family transposase [Bryobacteraceae bacterium]
MGTGPDTLQEAVLYFADPNNCREYLVAHRWPNGVRCPRCGSDSVTFQPKYNRWQCGRKHDLRQFTAKTGTIFEDSPLGLDKWLVAMWLVVNCKNGVSSYEVHRAIGVSQKTAWFMDHRIRFALGMTDGGNKLSGECEADETFIGGKARNMHIDKRKRRITATGPTDKVAVMGILQRGENGESKVRTVVVPNRRKKALQAEVRKHVEAGAALYTDALLSYDGLECEYAHQVIGHAEKYVDGRVHTNGLENFWSLLKRSINGTYVSVEPFHLFRYLDEQAFRYNNRKDLNDGDRFSLAVSQIVGKRLTWDRLTGKNADGQSSMPLI